MRITLLAELNQQKLIYCARRNFDTKKACKKNLFATYEWKNKLAQNFGTRSIYKLHKLSYKTWATNESRAQIFFKKEWIWNSERTEQFT